MRKNLVELRERVLRAVSLVVTDRRWAAPLSAMALGFGLFLGVAIGPGAAGSLATGAGPIVAISAPAAGGGEESAGEGEAGGEAAISEPEPEAVGVEPEPFEPEPLEPSYEPEPVVSEPEPEEEEAPAREPEEEEEEAEVETQQLEGTVVHANPAAGSYTMAIAAGELVSVHAAKLPAPGTKLTVEGTSLVNNTFAEVERERAGGSARASLSGVVTYVDSDPAAPAYTVSGRGSSILVHVDPAAAAAMPVLGAYATVAVEIEKPLAEEAPVLPPPPVPAPEAPLPEPPSPCLVDPALKPAPAPTATVVQRRLEVEPEPATYVDLAGIVSGVCPATGQLLISADDLRQSEDDLLLNVPKGLETAALKVGDSVLATANVEEDGSLTLAGLASDERLEGAEDERSAQGDLKR